MSVTDREVINGILNANDTQAHCLAYIRRINNLNMNMIKYARNFIDMIGKDKDTEAQKLLSTLRDVKLPQKLIKENIADFSVEWSGKEGIEKETHQEYLDEFCDHFYK